MFDDKSCNVIPTQIMFFLTCSCLDAADGMSLLGHLCVRLVNSFIITPHAIRVMSNYFHLKFYVGHKIMITEPTTKGTLYFIQTSVTRNILRYQALKGLYRYLFYSRCGIDFRNSDKSKISLTSWSSTSDVESATHSITVSSVRQINCNNLLKNPPAGIILQ